MTRTLPFVTRDDLLEELAENKAEWDLWACSVPVSREAWVRKMEQLAIYEQWDERLRAQLKETDA